MNYSNLFDSRKAHTVLLLLICIYPLLLIFQGIDFTDFGFWLSNYSLLYKYPEDISKLSYLSYLSLVIGNIALNITPFPGPLNVRISWILVILANFAILFHILRPYFKKSTILLAFLCAEIFLLQRSTIWISYNDLSGLSNAFILFLAFKSFQNPQHKVYWILLGLACAAGYWIRLPNILNITIPAITLFFVRKNYIKHILLIAAGYVFFHIIIVSYMSLNNQLTPYLTALFEGFAMSKDAHATHESSKLLTKFIRDFYLSSTFAIVILSLTVLFSKIYSKFLDQRERLLRLFLFTLMTFLFFFLLNNTGFQILRTIGFRHEYTVLLTLITFLAYPALKGNKSLIFYYVVSLVIIYITPLGSDIGMKNSQYGAFPIVVGLICFYWEQKSTTWLLKVKIPHSFVVIALIAGVYLSIRNVYYFKYRDDGPRSLFTHTPGGSFFGLFTREERAKTINELETAIDKHTSSNDILLEYKSIPMVFFLTQARPFLGTTWSHSITSPVFIKTFKRNIERGIYPNVIIRPIYTARSHNWPLKSGYRQYRHLDAEAVEFTDSWILENNYKIIWKNDYFEILKPVKH